MNILFFAALREHLGCDQYSLDIPLPSDIRSVRAALIRVFPRHATLLTEGKTLAAVNQTLVQDTHVVNAGDEVAFFPPVTGG